MRISSQTKFLILTTILFASLFFVRPVQVQGYVECNDPSRAGIETGDTVYVEYTGTKESDGSVFDSTEGKGPVKFVISPGQLIQGFYEGMLGLELRTWKTITVPPSKGYTDPSAPLYGETLIFRVYVASLDSTTPVNTCTIEDRSGFSSTFLNALGWVFGIGVGGFIFISLYLAVQRTTTSNCVHCKEHNKSRPAEGTCSKCGAAFCRQSFAKGCPKCGNNTFIPYDKNL
jgi:hypothetical protein